MKIVTSMRNAYILIIAVLLGNASFATTASFTNTTVCDGNSTQFISTSTATTGSIITHEWDFNGDSIYDASGINTTYQFDSAGTYDVLLKITTDSGFVSYTSNPVTVHPNPRAQFSYTGNCLGDPTTFDGSAVISNGTISGYHWDFDGDKDFNDASGAAASFTFVAPQYHQVGFRAVSNQGCATDTFSTVTIGPKPNVNFTADNVCNGQAVDFINNSGSQGLTMTYKWKFGNDSTSSVKEPDYVYASAGDYTVRLIGENAAGCSDSLDRDVSVYPTPVADFSTSDVCYGDTVEISNNSTYGGATVQNNFWDFGNGSTRFDLKTTQTVQYDAAATFDVTLSISTANQCYDTITKAVTVNPLPEFGITSSGPTEFCDGGSVTLTVEPDSNVITAWSTGENTTSITVSGSGVYEVGFFSQAGCQYRTSEEVTVRYPSELTVSNDTAINNGDMITLSVSGAMQYEWGNLEDNSQAYLDEVEISPTQTTTYGVVAWNEYGCESSGEVTVEVVNDFGLTPTNMITPDGNGKNDTWYIENITRYPGCEVIIYNSYGKQIYNKTGYTNDFDGTINGQKLPDGTYYYVISCDGRDEKFSGNLTIMRINE